MGNYSIGAGELADRWDAARPTRRRVSQYEGPADGAKLSPVLIIGFALFSTAVSADRIKDLASHCRRAGKPTGRIRLVVGLSGSGDKNLGITLPILRAMLSRFGMSTDVTGLNGSMPLPLWLQRNWARF